MKTFEFKSTRNWIKTYDHLYETKYWNMTSYSVNAITVFNDDTENELVSYCKAHRIAIKEM